MDLLTNLFSKNATNSYQIDQSIIFHSSQLNKNEFCALIWSHFSIQNPVSCLYSDFLNLHAHTCNPTAVTCSEMLINFTCPYKIP